MKAQAHFKLYKDPFRQFDAWFKEAAKAHELLPESMALATAGRDGRPSVRMVLLKSFSKDGFVFFTNYESRKSADITDSAFASLLFHWPKLERQVRIEGRIRKTSRAESVAYFKTRPRESQLGAWASPQSSAIQSRDALEARLAEVILRFQGKVVPCPPNWGGYRVAAERIEFWQGRRARLHDRAVYVRKGKSWKQVLLAP